MKFSQIFSGKLTKREFACLYVPSVLGMVVCWAIARALYADGAYSMDLNPISTQGSLVSNPIGGWFFIVSTACVGLFLTPYFIFMYRRMLPTLKILAILFLLSGCVGGIGLFLVGISPEGSGPMLIGVHGIGSQIAFYGLGIAAGLSVFIMLGRILQRRSWPTLSQFSVVIVLSLFFGLMLFFTTIWSVQQWTGFYTIFAWSNGMFLILPNEWEEKALDPATGSLDARK